jgi:hypothetical protein
MITRHAPRLTAIGSGKGGTGKTLIAVSLAHALSHEGERILLCDADLGLSNTSVHLGLESGGNLPGLLAKDCALRDATVPVLGGAAATRWIRSSGRCGGLRLCSPISTKSMQRISSPASKPNAITTASCSISEPASIRA